MRHGLYTRALILNSPHLKEDITDYNSIVYALDRDLLPVGLFEEYLVRKIANCLWRMRRVIAAENAYIEYQLERNDRAIRGYINEMNDNYDDPVDDRPPEEVARIEKICIGRKLIPREYIGRHIMRYEMRLDRQLSRTLRILLNLQKRRKSKDDNEQPDEQQKMSKRTQISSNPLYENPLADID